MAGTEMVGVRVNVRSVSSDKWGRWVVSGRVEKVSMLAPVWRLRLCRLGQWWAKGRRRLG